MILYCNGGICMSKDKLRVGDYITYFFEKQIYNGKILDIHKGKAKIEICISWKKAEEPLFEEIEDVMLSELQRRY